MKVLKIIFFNAILILLSFLVYGFFTNGLLKNLIPVSSYDSEVIIGFSCLFIVLFSFLKKTKPVSIGFGFLSANLILLIFLELNQLGAVKGTYQSYKLRKAYSINTQYFINVGFNMYSNEIKVAPEICLNVDSILVRVDHGLFNLKFASNQFDFKQNENCEPIHDSTLTYLELGHLYAKSRCSNKANELYFKDLNESNSPETYYHLGLSYTMLKQYNLASEFFYKGQELLKSRSNLSDTEISRLVDFEQRIESLNKLKGLDANKTAGNNI